MIRTSACEVLGITQPIVLAGMGNTGDPALVAAVSEAGGLGILGCTWRGIEQTREAIRDIRARTSRPFGVNFVLHLTDPAALDDCLQQSVPVFSFFRGDPTDAVEKAHGAGAVAIHQVTTVEEATQAAAIGTDIIIAQGREAGGHMGPLPLWSFLPEAVAAAAGRPVLAAGGMTDGKDLAAALSLGASGILMGTRFLASTEAAVSEEYKRALVAARLGDTVNSTIWDLLWDASWPGISVRAFRNEFVARWHGREDELLAGIDAARAEFREAEARRDYTRYPMLAGEGAGRIKSILPVARIVRETVSEAEAVLRGIDIR